MRSFDELDQAWSARPRLPRDRGRIARIVVRTARGVHATPERVAISREHGVDGDHWATGKRDLAAQITVMMSGVAELIAGPDRDGTAVGDNFLVELDLGEDNVPIGSRLQLGSAVIEVSTKPHAGCKIFSGRFGDDALRWVNHKPLRPLRLRGLHAWVIEPGEVSVGDEIVVVSRGGQ